MKKMKDEYERILQLHKEYKDAMNTAELLEYYLEEEVRNNMPEIWKEYANGEAWETSGRDYCISCSDCILHAIYALKEAKESETRE
jgi:hypothetical protein